MKIKHFYTFKVTLFTCLLHQAFAFGNSDKKFDADMSSQNLSSKDTVQHSFIADTSKWHPDMFYIVYPDLRITFKLPYEKDQSGVANLLFKNKKTGSIHLLDTVKNNIRYYSRLKGKYDAILLYNNGKYIRRNDVFFMSDTVDMTNLNVQPCDSESQHWLTLRTFNASVGDRGKLCKNYTTDSKLKSRGYVFFEDGKAIDFAGVRIDGSFNKQTIGTLDGYIEFESDINQKIDFFCVGANSYEKTLTANSGLFVVLEYSNYYGDELDNAPPAQLIKIR